DYYCQVYDGYFNILF
nr:immunoglobulin light chain junction region [Macaca mulatta]